MRINIFTMSQRIWFGTQPSFPVANQVLESREVFLPMDLATSELLCGLKVLEVLVIGEHMYNMWRSHQVVAPLLEGLKDREQLLVIDLVVELCQLHATGVECNWMDFPIIGQDLGDDCYNCIVRSISFNDNGIIRVEMHQDGCLGEGVFEALECLGVIRAPGEWGVLACEVNQGNDDVLCPITPTNHY